MFHLPYNKNLKDFSRYLRNNSTLSEVILWNELKARQMMGYTFNRQKPLDRYIVDFYCNALKLVIEIDGSSHDDEIISIKDKKRQKILEDLGLSFIRFADKDVKFNLKNVVQTIVNFILDFEEGKSP